jgi:tetratricopeptide (TPR) repeat protein
MTRIFKFFVTLAGFLGLFAANAPALAQNAPGNVSIYTYRTVTNRLTNQNESLSRQLAAQRQRASNADTRWREAEGQLTAAKRSGDASARRVIALEAAAKASKAEFAAAIDDLNARLAQQDADYDRLLRAATAAGNDLLTSEAGQRALALIALGGVDNNEAALQILFEETAIANRVDRLKIADRARTNAVTVLGLRGQAPSATTARLIALYEEVVASDPDVHWDWVELRRAYFDAGRLADARRAAGRALATAGDDRDRSVAYVELGDVQVAQGDAAAALVSYRQSLAIRETLAKADPSSAALQRDLWVSYWNLALLGDPAFPWSRVAANLEDMAAKGTLFPVDEKFLIEARRLAAAQAGGNAVP